MSVKDKLWRSGGVDLASCPYYRGVGKCESGCHEEPSCITDEPLDGWPSLREPLAPPSPPDGPRTPEPTTEPIIGSDGEVTFPPGMGWETIANELAAEVTRLHNEIDRLKGGGEAPLASHADWTHPLYPTWVELGLDDLSTLQEAWGSTVSGNCFKCGGRLVDGPYLPFVTCEEDQLCFIATAGSLALDTLERAIDRGPDS